MTASQNFKTLTRIYKKNIKIEYTKEEKNCQNNFKLSRFDNILLLTNFLSLLKK